MAPDLDGDPADARPVVALTADLLFAARVRSAAEAVGCPLQLARSAAQLIRFVEELAPRLVIVDLDLRGSDPIVLIHDLKKTAETGHLSVLAYGAHVNEEKLEQARAAGADRVMPRGMFARQLATILAPRA
jgi:CheY-like chemotaxis protein